jgi:hypothetical protein
VKGRLEEEKSSTNFVEIDGEEFDAPRLGATEFHFDVIVVEGCILGGQYRRGCLPVDPLTKYHIDLVIPSTPILVVEDNEFNWKW